MRVVFLVILLLVVGFGWFFLRQPVSSIIRFITSASSSSLPSHSGRTNFLILGIGGGYHESPDLTDTIIFASISPSSSPVLLSIPRDLWVPSLQAKINTAFHYGREKAGDSGGLILAKSAVSEIIDQSVDFVVVFDFATFSQVVDYLGGIDVQVERSFTDTQYPIAGKEDDLCAGDPEYKCRYETITFAKGQQHMDGNIALKFVRSRHSGDSEEGTDFARSQRQAQVIQAIKDKLLSRPDPALYRRLYDLIIQKIQTDIAPDHYFALTKLAMSARKFNLKSHTLSTPDQLYHPPVSGKYLNQWVLTPLPNDPQSISRYVADLLN